MEKFTEGNITGNVLTHMIHCEDLLLEGYAACNFMYDTLEDVFDTLKGNTPSRSTKIKLKVDGCVSPDTLVKTNLGLKKIGELQGVNPKETPLFVEAFNEKTGKDEMTPVISSSFKKGNKKWVQLEFDNGTKLVCTEDHPIFTLNRGYVRAGRLTTEDILKE